MKKKLAMLLAVMFLLISACRGESSSHRDKTPDDGTSTSAPRQTKKPTKGESAEAFPLKGTIEETVLLDEADVKITATRLDYTSYAAELSLTIENNTDQELSFTSGTISCNFNSINGYMFDGGYINVDIPAGKKANETMSFSASELMVLGITDIADLEIGIKVTDKSYATYLLAGPLPIKTSLSGSYDYRTDTYQDSINGGMLAAAAGYTLDYFSDDTLFDQCGVQVISQALITNQDGNKVLILELENTSEDMVFVTTWNYYVNGLKIQDKLFSSDCVNPGKRRVKTIQLSNMLDDAYWELLGIDDPKQVEFSIGIEDPEGSDLFEPDPVSVTMQNGPASFNERGDKLYDQDDIQIIFKELILDDSKYSDDIHALYIVKNDGQDFIDVWVASDSISVNGYMIDSWGASRSIFPGRAAVFDLSLDEDSLADIRVGGVEDIEELEAVFTIRDEDYELIAEPTVTAAFKR